MEKAQPFHPARILCPVDFSDLSNLALKYAATGARAFGANVIVFHAERFELPAYFTSSQVTDLTRQHRLEQKRLQSFLRLHTRKILGHQADNLQLAFDSADIHPVDAILAAAQKHRADLIIIGTHGRGGAKRLWLGSVVENVVRQAEVPVFVARQNQREFIDPSRPDQEPRLRKVLCPVNFAPVARKALQAAAAVAQRFQARLLPLSIMESDDKRSLPSTHAELRSWVADSVGAGTYDEPIIRKGRSAEEILTVTRESDAELVVLGAQRTHSAGSWLWGGTTELVLRQAPVPVLVIPET